MICKRVQLSAEMQDESC